MCNGICINIYMVYTIYIYEEYICFVCNVNLGHRPGRIFLNINLDDRKRDAMSKFIYFFCSAVPLCACVCVSVCVSVFMTNSWWIQLKWEKRIWERVYDGAFIFSKCLCSRDENIRIKLYTQTRYSNNQARILIYATTYLNINILDGYKAQVEQLIFTPLCTLCSIIYAYT